MGGFGFLNLIPKLPDFAGAGLNYGVWRAQQKNYASQVRHLRRREYQDMMFSMKQAGLNPILAAGATPGHSAAMMGHGGMQNEGAGVGSAVAANESARASNRQAGVAEVKAPAEVAKLTTGRFLDAAQIGRIVLENAYTAESTRKVKAETDLALQESGTAAVKRYLMMRQAEKEGASARDIAAHVAVNTGDPRAIAGRMISSAQEADRQMGGWSGLADKIGDTIWNATKGNPKVNPNAGKPGVGRRAR